MVTQVKEPEVIEEGQQLDLALVLEHPLVHLHPAANELGILVDIRPWWGSRREPNHRQHTVCGDDDVFDAWDFDRHIIRTWCHRCRRFLPEDEIKVLPMPHKWLCPRVKYPQVQNGTVVFWEGECGMEGHNHCQSIELIDVGETALLVSLRTGIAGRNFLIGKDDGPPFATAIVRRVTTVQDAFDWLVPKLVREAYILGKEVKRQGDWFFIPTDEDPLNRRNGGSMQVFGSDPILATDTLYRDVHLIYNGVQTRHIGSMVVHRGLVNTCYGAPRVKGEVRAPDHPTMTLDSWHIGVRRRSSSGTVDETTRPGLD